MRTFQSRGATIALVVAVAIGFFFLGYSARTIRVAAAQPTSVPISQPPPDGNPVGHQLNPPKNYAAPPGIDQHLRWLAQHRIAIRYQLAPPKLPPWHPPAPACSNGQPHCFNFVWKNMTIETMNHNGTLNTRWNVDVHGTLSAN
ncbi:MAG TPA: hypothetical protein VIW73_10115 [Candidatus Cybelea sp.]